MSTKSSFWFRSRTPILLGVGACVACCALPLAAIAIGAGAATTAALILEPLAAVLVALGIGMALVAYVRRRRVAAGSETIGACAVDGSCGCGPTIDDRAIAVGCTLPRDDLPLRSEEFRALFARGLKHREVEHTRAVWTFAWTPELERDARALATAEQGCCSFWRFELRRSGDELRWEATVPPDRLAAIAMLDSIAAASMTSSTRA